MNSTNKIWINRDLITKLSKESLKHCLFIVFYFQFSQFLVFILILAGYIKKSSLLCLYNKGKAQMYVHTWSSICVPSSNYCQNVKFWTSCSYVGIFHTFATKLDTYRKKVKAFQKSVDRYSWQDGVKPIFMPMVLEWNV